MGELTPKQKAQESMELWRRACNPNCDTCYGRGWYQHRKHSKAQAYIMKCHCVPDKPLQERIKANDVTLIGRRR